MRHAVRPLDGPVDEGNTMTKNMRAAVIIAACLTGATVVSLWGVGTSDPKQEPEPTATPTFSPVVHSRSATGIHTVKEYAVPPCEYEDGSGAQGLPCRWDAHVRGNGIGLSYTILKDGHVRYDKDSPDPAGTGAPVWMVTADDGSDTPGAAHIGEAYEVGIQDHWRWLRVDTQFADALAEGGSPHADTRKWEQCVYSHVVIVCPDGYVENMS